MEINQHIISSSSPGDEDQHLNPDDSADQSAVTDEVSFGFNHLQIDTNDESNPQELMTESPEIDDDDDEEEEEDGDFTFAFVGDSDSPTTEVSDAGQIRKVFPLFDQSLLLGGDYDDGKLRLPIEVPVDKVFIESRPSPLKHGEPAGTVILSEVTESSMPELNTKSNSTGFSKLWRFRNEMNRSNSDSRDAFVFLESPDRATTSEAKANGVAVARSADKVNGAGGGKGKAVRKGLNTKKSAASAHEVYLKQKGGQTEEERRRSYLPYRPGLMGFFTNVNGGLSKNVHPF